MHQTERVGYAEVLADDRVLVVGGYRLSLEGELAACVYGEPSFTPLRARGTIRLYRGQPILDVLTHRTLSVRLDRFATLRIDVHLYVRSAGLIAFTCRDPEALAALVSPT